MFGANVSKTKGTNRHKVWRRFIEQNKKVDKLEEQVSFQENTINQLLIKCDNNEQYSWCNCLQIHGIESKKMKK